MSAVRRAGHPLWGFEGWASSEFAIAPDGAVAGTRIAAAYPPFIFGKSAGRIVARTRCQPHYVADGAPRVLERQSVTFLLP